MTTTKTAGIFGSVDAAAERRKALEAALYALQNTPKWTRGPGHDKAVRQGRWAVQKEKEEGSEKQAAACRSSVRRMALTKCASLAGDLVAHVVGGSIPYVGAPASTVGSIAGVVADPEGDKNHDTTLSSFIPGVGSYRLQQRIKRVAEQSNAAGTHGTANYVSEMLGPLTSSAIAGGAGALIGNAVDNENGALAGGLAGAGIPILVAAIAAAVRRKRSREEQIASDTTGRAIAKYIVPGLATYDAYKRLGASTHNDRK